MRTMVFTTPAGIYASRVTADFWLADSFWEISSATDSAYDHTVQADLGKAVRHPPRVN